VGPGVSSAISCPRLGSCYGRGFACRSNSRRGGGASGRVAFTLRGVPPTRLPHLLFPSSMPKRRDFPPRALRGSVEPQQFPWAEGYPVFLPIPSAGKTIRVLRGRFILELTDSAPETSGLRRQGFTPYKTLLMPAFSLPRPPGELALPPSPANGTFHYPTSLPPAAGCIRRRLPTEGFSNPPAAVGWKSTKPRLRHFAQPRYIGEDRGLIPLSYYAFFERSPLRDSSAGSLEPPEKRNPSRGNSDVSGRVDPPPSAPALCSAVALLSGGTPLGPVPLNTLSRGRAPQIRRPRPFRGGAHRRCSSGGWQLPSLPGRMVGRCPLLP